SAEPPSGACLAWKATGTCSPAIARCAMPNARIYDAIEIANATVNGDDDGLYWNHVTLLEPSNGRRLHQQDRYRQSSVRCASPIRRLCSLPADRGDDPAALSSDGGARANRSPVLISPAWSRRDMYRYRGILSARAVPQHVDADGVLRATCL